MMISIHSNQPRVHNPTTTNASSSRFMYQRTQSNPYIASLTHHWLFPSPKKLDNPQQPINCTNICCGVSHVLPLLRFCALGLVVNFAASHPRAAREKKIGHGIVFPPGATCPILVPSQASRP